MRQSIVCIFHQKQSANTALYRHSERCENCVALGQRCVEWRQNDGWAGTTVNKIAAFLRLRN